MKSLRLFSKNSLVKKEAYEIKEYCTMDYEKAKDNAATILIVQLLKNMNDALSDQPFLREDIQLLAEKAFQKIDIRAIIVDTKCSYQRLNYQYLEVLSMFGLWQMLQEKFIDFDLIVTEDIFRKVTTFLMSHMKELGKKEKAFLEQVASKCISQREDGRIEIIFTGEIWGNEKLVEETMERAEKAGICFVDIPSSPISKKAILPFGWGLYNSSDGYTHIMDEFNVTRGVFRIKELPNKYNHGEFDFFFDFPGLNKGNRKDQIGAHKNPLLSAKKRKLLNQ